MSRGAGGLSLEESRVGGEGAAHADLLFTNFILPLPYR